MKNYILKKLPHMGFFALVGVNIFFVVFLFQSRDVLEELSKKANPYPEIALLESLPTQSFLELTEYFSGIAREKGGAYAFEVLKRASVPLGTDMHLLGHVVGGILYAQDGLEGIKTCTHDFRNACSHTIVIGLFLEQGQAALPQIAEACYQAPGGSGAYTMCFHGLGHGVLAHAGYNLEKAAQLCQKTGTANYNYRESAECVGGALMEMIAGIHDKDAWAKELPNYLKTEEPLYPCSADFIPAEAKYMCYVYLTPHFFKVVGINLSSPTPENYREAFRFCSEIPVNETRNRDACYGGFGKEFVVLAQNRDIRKIESMTEEQLQTVYEWCLVADNKDGVISCIHHATNSLYWGGENDRSTAIQFCNLIGDPAHQEPCFNNLIGSIQAYIQDRDYKNEFCDELPISYQEKCRFYLL